MLLPSMLPRDASYSSHPRFRLSLCPPPASPRAFSLHTSFANIITTCRSLQSLLATPAPIVTDSNLAPSLTNLPTPSLDHATPPLKLRLRPRPQRREPLGPKKVTKRAATHATIKKRRITGDDMDQYSSANECCSKSCSCYSLEQVVPVTPKRTRIAPEQLPLGLNHSDFHNIHLRQDEHLSNKEDSGEEVWSAQDDRILIEIVLEKLRLSKAEWQDCARNLGRDGCAIDRRWKALLLNGDVGLKSRPGH